MRERDVRIIREIKLLGIFPDNFQNLSTTWALNKLLTFVSALQLNDFFA